MEKKVIQSGLTSTFVHFTQINISKIHKNPFVRTSFRIQNCYFQFIHKSLQNDSVRFNRTAL